MIIVFPNFIETTTLPCNDYFEIYYTAIADSVWEVDSMEWPEWVARTPYVAPQQEPLLLATDRGGVPLELHEHACVCIQGSCLHKFRTNSGDTVDYDWTYGEHNVENGYGYKPTLGFRREATGTFAMCCVGSKKGRDWSKQHTFQILTDSAVLPRGASFIHVALGSATINGVTYSPRDTAHNLNPGVTVTVSQGSSIIVCVSEN